MGHPQIYIDLLVYKSMVCAVKVVATRPTIQGRSKASKNVQSGDFRCPQATAAQRHCLPAGGLEP